MTQNEALDQPFRFATSFLLFHCSAECQHRPCKAAVLECECLVWQACAFFTRVCTSYYRGYFINWLGNAIVSSLYYLALAHALIVFIKFIAPCRSISLYAVWSSSPPAGVQFNGLFFNENDMIFTACPQRWLFQYSICCSLYPCPFVSPRVIVAWMSQELAVWTLACLILYLS